MFLFDTDTLSQVLRQAPSPNLMVRLAAVPADEQFTTAITVGEKVYGAHRSPRREYLLRESRERVLPKVEVLYFDQAAGEAYGRLRAELEGAGTPIGEADTRIAAIALTHDLTVVTGNVRHFSLVPGLRVESWI